MDEEEKIVTEEVTYQPGDKYFVDMTKYEDDSVVPKTVYAKWQPSVTVNYFVDGELLESTGEMYEDYSVTASAPKAPSKANSKFIGWVDENGEAVDKIDALGIITTGVRVEPKVVNVYAKYENIPVIIPPVTQPEPDPAPTPTDPMGPTDPIDPPDEPDTPDIPDNLDGPGQVDPSGDNDPIVEPSGDSDKTDNETKGVKTGDETMLAMWGALCLVTALALGGTLLIGRRREE